jgi:hypothetical protein
MVIDVIRICGTDIISRDAGRKIRDLLLAHWAKPSLEVVFGGRRVGSVSFFDEAFGLLIKRGNKGIEEIKGKLKFPDMREEDRRLLNHVLFTRVQESRS